MEKSRETELAEKRTGLSVERTSLAFERTSLANSQTLLSYSRTTIAVFAAGIGMFEFISNQTIVTIGVILMAISPVIMIIGVVHYIKVRNKLKYLLDEMEDE
ncbi:MAG: DUF202 domain-containing protein [Firmicutes bacterium]|nr:DUF202 domain-containing protein [Bacillota bacterium]